MHVWCVACACKIGQFCTQHRMLNGKTAWSTNNDFCSDRFSGIITLCFTESRTVQTNLKNPILTAVCVCAVFGRAVLGCECLQSASPIGYHTTYHPAPQADTPQEVTLKALSTLLKAKNTDPNKPKYEYDSDEETENGTWEHKQRAAEIESTTR